MASGTVHIPKKIPTLYNKLFTATTDGTGNVVLGADFDSRLIVNIQTTNTLICWQLGVASGATAKMLHFTNYQGGTLASTAVTFRVFWFNASDFDMSEVT